jgi:hypothetical protein
MVHDLAFVLIGVFVFNALAIGRGTTCGPMYILVSLSATLAVEFPEPVTYPSMQNGPSEVLDLFSLWKRVIYADLPTVPPNPLCSDQKKWMMKKRLVCGCNGK